MSDPSDYQKRYEYLYRSPHVKRVTVRSSDGKSHIIKRPESHQKTDKAELFPIAEVK